MASISSYTPIAIRDPGDNLIAFGYQQVRFLGSVSVIEIAGQTQITIGGGAAIQVRDEGVPVVSTGTLNFVGAGVTVTNNAGVAEISIPGGANVTVQDEGSPIVSTGTINFVGPNVTVTNSPLGVARVEISAGIPSGGNNRLAYFNNTGSLTSNAALQFFDSNNNLFLGTSSSVTKAGTNFIPVIGNNIVANFIAGSYPNTIISGGTFNLTDNGLAGGSFIGGINSTLFTSGISNSFMYNINAAIGTALDTFRYQFSNSAVLGTFSGTGNLLTTVRPLSNVYALGANSITNFDGTVTGYYALGSTGIGASVSGSTVNNATLIGNTGFTNTTGTRNIVNSMFVNSSLQSSGNHSTSYTFGCIMSSPVTATNSMNNVFAVQTTISSASNDSFTNFMTVRGIHTLGAGGSIVNSANIGENTMSPTGVALSEVFIFGRNNNVSTESNIAIFGFFRNPGETNDIIQLAAGDGATPGIVSFNALRVRKNNRAVFVKTLGFDGVSQTLLDTFTIPVQFRGYLRLDAVAPRTSSAVTAIQAGLNVGQTLILENNSANSITLVHNAGIKLNGAANVTLTQFSTISFIWNGTFWLETSRSIV